MSKQELITASIFITLFVLIVACTASFIADMSDFVTIENIGSEIRTIEQEFNKGYNKGDKGE